MCDKIVYDYILGLCYVVPCELSEISMNYLEKLQMLGVIT